MIEYESFVFLGNPKAGSTYVEEFLNKFCSEPKLRGEKHARVMSEGGKRRRDGKPGLRNTPAQGKPYIISVRDPASLYVSLYNYARTGEGGIRSRLERKDRAHLLDADQDPERFHQWLDTMLDPEQARLTGGRKFNAVAPLFGFWTYRYLRLAMVDGREKCEACKTVDEVRELYAREKIVDHVLLNERLSADLQRLFIAPGLFAHAVKDQEGALAWLTSGTRSNESPPVVTRSWLRPAELERIYAREWFLSENFGYGRPAETQAAAE